MAQKKIVSVYIVDDSQEAISQLAAMLNDYSVSIVGTATNPLEAEDDIVEQSPDLLFLDVEMPQTTGLDFWQHLRDRLSGRTKVVFYTGYDKYVLEALRRQAFDYLLKPATAAELARLMTRYYESRLSDAMAATAIQPAAPQPLMIVNARGEHVALHINDVAFFRYHGLRRLWEVVLMDSSSTLLRHRTTSETILSYAADFVQIHKSYIVNVRKIARIQDTLCILVPPLDTSTELRVSKNFRHDLLAAFYNL